MELKDIRNTIDQIDDQMLELFVRRMEVARDVAAYKKEHGLPILDSGREREVLNRVTERAGEGLERYAKLLYQTMFDLSRGYQSALLSAGSPLMKRLEEEGAVYAVGDTGVMALKPEYYDAERGLTAVGRELDSMIV